MLSLYDIQTGYIVKVQCHCQCKYRLPYSLLLFKFHYLNDTDDTTIYNNTCNLVLDMERSNNDLFTVSKKIIQSICK